MRRLALCSIIVAVGIVVPAQAKQPPKPQTAAPGQRKQPPKPQTAKARKCAPRSVGYQASGTLVAQTLTLTAGAATPDRGDDRYSGTITVDVVRANHRAPKGEQTYTLQNARVQFADPDGDGTPAQPAAGDRVRVTGKITVPKRRCESEGFTASITVRKAQFKPKAADRPTS